MAATFPSNHERVYWDTLCRTKKSESVLSLIMATYRAKEYCKKEKLGFEQCKEITAKYLVNAYEIYKGSAGTYQGTISQFQSQYTIGHELCIWKNSELDLTDLAVSVAESRITIRDYFDIVFLNYIQPVNGNIVHILYHLLSFLKKKGSPYLTKNDMGEVFKAVGHTDNEGDLNGTYQMLISTNYFKVVDQNELKFDANCSIDELISRCNITYVEKGYEAALSELDSEEAYIAYLLKDRRYNEGKDDEEETIKTQLTGGENILLYGVPGCGKSHEIQTKYCDDDNRMERAVFHPDYTYSDFVGQILPKISEDKRVTYEFEPGPFTRILHKAEKSPEKYFYLIVEEINRGNSPAIFGDIFQLLDRDENGNSEYGISNESIAEYVYGNKNQKIRIPGNLYILATMNTSDQNVFTLDTAFKRRWAMKHIENDIDSCDFADQEICESGISWSIFAKTINRLLIEVNADNLSNEDNRLGAYFVKLKELKDPSLFGEKVLMYLWNDAFKYDHEKVFKSEYKTLDELIDGFKTEGLDVFINDIVFLETESNLKNGSVKEVDVEQYLSNKKDYLLSYYYGLRDLVKEKVPGLREATTGSLQYAAWRANDIKKSSFADLYIQSDKITIFTETPTNQDFIDIGQVVEKDGHHNHYFKVVYSDERKREIADIIIESYEQLKGD